MEKNSVKSGTFCILRFFFAMCACGGVCRSKRDMVNSNTCNECFSLISSQERCHLAVLRLCNLLFLLRMKCNIIIQLKSVLQPFKIAGARC